MTDSALAEATRAPPPMAKAGHTTRRAPPLPVALRLVAMALIGFLGLGGVHALAGLLTGLPGVAPTLNALLAAVLSVLLLLVLMFTTRLIRDEAMLLPLLVAGYCLQLMWASSIEMRPIGELAEFWSRVRLFAVSFDGGLANNSTAPFAVVLHGLLQRVIGASMLMAQMLAAGLWTLAAWLLWRIMREVQLLRPLALMGCALAALNPLTMIFGAMPMPEALGTCLQLFAIERLITQQQRGLLRSCLMAGLAVGLAMLTCVSGWAVMIAILTTLGYGALAASRAESRRRFGQGLLGFVAMVALVMSVMLLDNHRRHGWNSVLPWNWVATHWLAGVGGMTDPGPIAAAIKQAGVGTQPLPQALGQLRQAALSALTPMALLRPFGDKAQTLWGDSLRLVNAAVDGSPIRAAIDSSGLRERLEGSIDGARLMLLVLAVIGLMRMSRQSGGDQIRLLLLKTAPLLIIMLFSVIQPGPRDQFILIYLIIPFTSFGASHFFPKKILG